MSDHTTRHSSEVKTCTRCGGVKPLSEFHVRRKSPDGLAYDCKECRRRISRDYYAANAEKARDYSRVRYWDDPESRRAARRADYWKDPEASRAATRDWYQANAEARRASRRAHYWVDPLAGREHARRYRQENPESRRATEQEYIRNNRDKKSAHDAVEKAVRAGKLPHVSTQVCASCGEQANHYHHYLGYAPEHRLDVTPLCSKCHGEIHRLEGG